ncbi:protein of unknown function [Catalinimonas alkaloidigena]|uniref:DUF2341 domain-containing protein n=1 Tax=Catalinimonas alkaloidigena TaxID=1075417 RepID=A0A1G9KAP0_9BACT|nr:DUF2341 domain-containing protein [Catalinimonas alkaloidigena]SDL46702.1 protein of unknown function [Catalinimonas alkaloidigena]
MKHVVWLSWLISVAALAQTPLSGWRYRTELEIDNSRNPEALQAYPVVFELNTARLIEQGKLGPEGNDVRFTDADGQTPLCFWREGALNQEATRYWVRIPYVAPYSRAVIFLYHGNPLAVASRQYNCTFAFFDDFEGTELNPLQWEKRGRGQYTLQDGQLRVDAQREDAILLSRQAFEKPLIVEMQVTDAAGRFTTLALLQDDRFSNGYVLARDGARERMELTLTEGEPTPCGGYAVFSNTRHAASVAPAGLWSLSWITTNTVFAQWPDGEALEPNALWQERPLRVGLGVAACQRETQGTLSVDWVRVRKLTSVEPRITVGAERYSEERQAPDAPWMTLPDSSDPLPVMSRLF